MEKSKVPLGPGRPLMDLTCARLFSLDPVEHCPKPATKHIMWDGETTENVVTCDEHFEEAKVKWKMFDYHPIGTACTMPDTLWFTSWEEPPGCCRWTVSEEILAMENAATPELERV